MTAGRFAFYAEPALLAGGHLIVGLGEIGGQDFVHLTNEAYLSADECEQLVEVLRDAISVMRDSAA